MVLNNDIITIIVVFGSILFFPTIICPQTSLGAEESGNQSNLQNQIIKEQDHEKNFENMSKKDPNKILGIVKNETLFPINTKSPMILTSVMMQEARTPEAGIIELRQYEGQIVLVSYQQSDDKIVWGTGIVDVVGPNSTIMVKKSFGLE
ncbi:hypothetical protein [Candidatus Nitrosocosmicus arcticus]|uniref:Uncharacterized protein n=1 Tax=Candidatus Nitrosocosmicus arcticus TaxID=2035267 RepID=A0A557SZ59_9ARCH|nr:hypothetical protein [Candidatus Nitrosocosmicus arcticus]TVP41892.1 exported protein of unknown function [Candidatus Nitrosocosmicus arcticus]